MAAILNHLPDWALDNTLHGADTSLQAKKAGGCKQAILFWNQGMLFASWTSLPSSHLLPKISKISKIRNCQRQINSDGTYSETSMSIVFISLPTPCRLITSDYIFKETFMHCKHYKNISLQVPISSIWQRLGASSQLKSLNRTSNLCLGIGTKEQQSFRTSGLFHTFCCPLHPAL